MWFHHSSRKGWLGASPDAKVFDPSCNLHNGIAEFKCPYSKRDKSPQEACNDSSFSCEMVNGKFCLKRTHQYYHQVQLQLYISIDVASWCDFCVYTPVGIATERIYPCREWQSKCIPQPGDYFDMHILPEIVNPVYKPSYIFDKFVFIYEGPLEHVLMYVPFHTCKHTSIHNKGHSPQMVIETLFSTQRGMEI